MIQTRQRIRWLHAVGVVCATLMLGACQPGAEERVARATASLEAGDYAAAVLEARSALQADPANLEARLVFADASRRVGDFRTAAAEYRRARELGADSSSMVADYAESLLVIGRPAELLSELTDALSAAPADARRLTLLGHAYAATGELTGAAERYQQAIAADSGQADAYVGLAVLADRREDLPERERWVAAAAANVADSPELLLYEAQQSTDRDLRGEKVEQAYALLGAGTSPVTRSQVLLARLEHQLQIDDPDAAQATLDEYRSVFPGAPQTLFLQSLVALEQGDIERARNGFLRISESVTEGSPADLFLGSINLRQSNLRQAEAYLNNALRYDASNVAARKLLAETLLQLGRAADALEVLSALAPAETTDPQILALLGRAAVASGDPRGGVEFFERSASSAPDDPGLRLATAYSHLAAGDADAALALLDAVPGDAERGYRATLLRMLAHLSGGDRAAAMGEAEALVRDHPADPAALSLAGRLMGNLGEFPSARRYYRAALAADGEHTPALYGLARVELAANDPAAAAELLDQLLDRDPGYMPAVAIATDLAVRAARTADAERYIDAAVAATPDDVAPRILLAQYRLQTGDLEGAIAAADEGLEMDADQARLLQIRGKARGQLGREEGGRQDLLRAAELAPVDRDMQMDKSRIQLQTGDRAGARRTIGDYLDNRPGDTTARLFAADLDLAAGLVESATVTVNDVLETQPDNRTALILRGDIDLQRGRLDDALASYASAAEIERDRAIVMREFRVRRQQGDERARGVLERWLSENPDDIQVATLVAQLDDAAGNTAAAARRYESLAQTRDIPDRERAVVLNNLAWLYHTNGDARALDTARAARDLAPELGPVQDTYGWILFRNGDLDAALPALRRAHQIAGRNPEIISHYAAALAANGDREQSLRLLEQALEISDAFVGRDEAVALRDELRAAGR